MKRVDIELITEKFWVKEIECRFETSDIALFFALQRICCQLDRKEQFACSNQQLKSLAHLSDKTLISARKRLIDARLIKFSPGTSKQQKSLYSFYTEAKDALLYSNIL